MADRRHAISLVFEAAAEAHRRTGAPILTHCEAGTGALEQVALLADLGVHGRHIMLSHVDKVVDRDYHREIVLAPAPSSSTTRSLRWGDAAERDAQAAALDGRRTACPTRSSSAMTQPGGGYYKVFGGTPGLGWLLDDFIELPWARPGSTRHPRATLRRLIRPARSRSQSVGG